MRKVSGIVTKADVEIVTSPTTHIIGSVEFSFETSEIIYNTVINFC